MKPFLIALVLIALLVACDNNQVKLKAGDPAPGFSLNDLDGNRVRFPEDFKGKAVAIRFWADWCPYCKTEMDEIEAVFKEYQTKGFVILALNVAQSGKRARSFTEKLGISYPVLLDIDSETVRKYRVVGLPTTFFVDRNGMLQNKILGEAELKVFQELVEKIMKEK